MELNDVRYEVEGSIARVRLNRPGYRNAQSWKLLDELDEALGRAMEDQAVRVVVVSGEGGNFSSGHDLGTPEQMEGRQRRGIPDTGLGYYDNFRHYNLDLTLKWRNLPKPTIAMVEGYCIFGGWMIAAAMDLVFAARGALLLPALVEYFSQPWDMSSRRAKELLFESRFITADEAHEAGFVSRVYEPEDLERETLAYAGRVAENTPLAVRMTKVAINRADDLRGYTSAMEAAFHDYLVMAQMRGPGRVEGARRLGGVDLALRRLKDEGGTGG
ncbi:MAG: enoyl-CoA hydratase-related protein [Dehalococcoidia bacterium]